jgi:hypothetical protein
VIMTDKNNDLKYNWKIKLLAKIRVAKLPPRGILKVFCSIPDEGE